MLGSERSLSPIDDSPIFLMESWGRVRPYDISGACRPSRIGTTQPRRRTNREQGRGYLSVGSTPGVPAIFALWSLRLSGSAAEVSVDLDPGVGIGLMSYQTSA